MERRAKNDWVDGGRYYVDSDGKKKRLKVTGFMIKTIVPYYYLTTEAANSQQMGR